MVLQAIEPQITLQGTERFWRPAAQFESARGVTLFPDIKIVSSFAKTEASGDTRATGTGAYGAAGGWSKRIYIRITTLLTHGRMMYNRKDQTKLETLRR